MAAKRKFTDAAIETIANKSDSDDEDYQNHAPSSQRSRKKPKGRSAAKPRRPTKRRRADYDDPDDDDEIDDDSDDISDDDDFGAPSEEEETAIVNPSTGRRQRKVVTAAKNYHESSESDDEVDDSESSPPRVKSESPAPIKSLIVVLKLSTSSLAPFSPDNPKTPYQASNRRTRAARTRSATPAHSALPTRKSSRISHDEDEELVALTTSGNHAEVARRGTATPEPQSKPQSRFDSLPSVIMEASQEMSQEVPASQDYDANAGPDGLLAGLSEFADPTGDDKLGTSVGESPFKPASHHDDGDEEDGDSIVMEDGDDEADETANAAATDNNEDDDDDEPVVTRGGRALRSRVKHDTPPAPPTASRSSRRSLRPRKVGQEQSSDFEPDAEEKSADERVSSSDELQHSRSRPRKSDNDSSSAGGRRSGRLAGKRVRASQHSEHSDDHASELDLDEIADEAADLEEDRRRNKRPRRTRRAAEGITFEPTSLRNRNNRPDYRVFRPELNQQDDEDFAAPAPASQRNKRGGAAPWRSLFSTLGPFGGAGGPAPVFGGPDGIGAAGGAESDSSDDDMATKMPRHSVGGGVGMTPTAGAPSMFPQTHNADPAQGGPSNFGKVKDKKALADADPLGVDPNVSFEGVGGLDDHIDRLKEMVALPLLYPEVFQQFKITPPRGVLFHGPPGTGKTLLARALASSVSSQGKKVTFYMRKGADALSKWVGEAERQLRLLFEEARKTQPSIIFFDEIDGLAPVRSSKQEQIHASIVATLLALMDGMDGRGQVVVIGATNRPDSVDPALRRPGRFDREFYFPLPNQPARRAIIDIHTKGWEPALQPAFKDQLAGLTKGYGGADLRALCTEAALNAVQGTFPQIYRSTKKLLIDPTKIRVLAKDFMISVNKIVPSSERSAASGAAPLHKSVEPLLRNSLAQVTKLLDEIIPQKKKATALEEAMYDDRDDERGFEKENLARGMCTVLVSIR